MASNLLAMHGLQPNGNGLAMASNHLQPTSHGLQPNGNGLAMASNHLQPTSHAWPPT